MALCSNKMSGTTHSTMQHHVLENHYTKPHNKNKCINILHTISTSSKYTYFTSIIINSWELWSSGLTSWCHIPEERNAPVTTARTSNPTIISFSCLLTSQCVSSAHSICTPYSTERGMNATWLVYLEHSGLLGCDTVSSHRWCWLLKASTNTRALPSFDISTTTCPVSQHHIPDSLNPQQVSCQNLKSWPLHLTQLCNFYVP